MDVWRSLGQTCFCHGTRTSTGASKLFVCQSRRSGVPTSFSITSTYTITHSACPLHFQQQLFSCSIYDIYDNALSGYWEGLELGKPEIAPADRENRERIYLPNQTVGYHQTLRSKPGTTADCQESIYWPSMTKEKTIIANVTKEREIQEEK